MSQKNDSQNEDFIKKIEAAKLMNSFWEAHSIEPSNKDNADNTSFNFYSEYFLMASILEAFITNEKLSLKELNTLAWNKIPESLIWTIPAHTYHSTILKMIRLGYITTIKNQEDALPILQISELGIKTLQEQTFQNLASTSFFNHQSYNFNKKSFTINLLAIAVAILSLVIAIIALI